MPITLGGLTFDQLSGPVNFIYLEPTVLAKTQFENAELQPLLLLGDIHYSLQNQCDDTKSPYDQCYYDQTSNTLSVGIMSTGWYRLLDTIASIEKPIDYYVETFFSLPYLQQPTHLMVDNAYLKPQDSVMMYMPQHHISCFTKDKSQCMTKHIRYHFTDIRQTKTSLELKAEILEVFKEYYEAQLFHTLIHIYANESHPLYSFVEQMLEGDNMMNAYILMFHMTDPTYQDTSLVFKQIKKQMITKDAPVDVTSEPYQCIIRFVMNYCFTYLTYIMTQDVYQEHVLMCKAFFTLKKQHTFANVLFANFATSFLTMFVLLYRPLIELYYLLRTWKVHDQPRGWLSIWNAGFMHTQNVAITLQSLGLYDIKMWVDTVGDKVSRKPEHVPTSTSANSSLAHEDRCILFRNVNVDMNTFNCLFNPSKHAQLRIQLLGSPLYLHVLNGGVISPQDMERIVRGDAKCKKMVDQLFLTEKKECSDRESNSRLSLGRRT